MCFPILTLRMLSYLKEERWAMTIIIELDVVKKQKKNIYIFCIYYFFTQLTYQLADVLFHGIVGFLSSTMSTKRACMEFH